MATILSLAAVACSSEPTSPGAISTGARIDPHLNKLAVTGDDRILWNGQSVDTAQLAALLGKTAKLDPQPELQFQPDMDASYDLSARVLDAVKAAKVTKLGFVGNEAYSASEAPSD